MPTQKKGPHILRPFFYGLGLVQRAASQLASHRTAVNPPRGCQACVHLPTLCRTRSCTLGNINKTGRARIARDTTHAATCVPRVTGFGHPKETNVALKKSVLGTLVVVGAAAVGGWFSLDKETRGLRPPCPPTAICSFMDAAATRRRLPRAGPHPAAGQGRMRCPPAARHRPCPQGRL